MTQARPSALAEMTPALRARFDTYVDRSDGCWEWRGPILRGYGHFHFNYQRRPAHRLAWEMAHETPLPVDKVIDHLCRNTRCVNPTHLQPVTSGENVLRGESPAALKVRRVEVDQVCVRGHDLSTNDAWYTAPNGERKCRACMPIVRRERYVRDRRNRGLPDFVRGRLCDVDGCDRPHYAKGNCKRHYNLEWRTARSNAA